MTRAGLNVTPPALARGLQKTRNLQKNAAVSLPPGPSQLRCNTRRENV